MSTEEYHEPIYAVERRLEGTDPDYWDHATMAELAVLLSDEDAADEHLGHALAAAREAFEPETTARNLRLIAEVREERGEDAVWIKELVRELANKHDAMVR